MVSKSGELNVPQFLWGQTRRHLGLLIASPGEIVNPLLFFLLVVILFPLGLGPDPAQLALLAPGDPLGRSATCESDDLYASLCRRLRRWQS
jgi:hypothetical protein